MPGVTHRCRPDFEVPALWRDAQAWVRGSSHAGSIWNSLQSGGRLVYPTPSAREGILWFLKAAGIGQGHEVALPALICETVADVIVAAGATPLVYGISSNLQPSPESLRQALTSATKAIIVPHLYGIPVQMEPFRELCAANKSLLIEDCAPCLPSQQHGVGFTGHCAVYSFKYDKPLALGWGGAITVSSQIAEQVGLPKFPMLSEVEDRLIAASLLLQQALTDIRSCPSGLGMSYALEMLLARPERAEELMSLLASSDGSVDLSAWWWNLSGGGSGLSSRRSALSVLGARFIRKLSRILPRRAGKEKVADGVSSRLQGRALLAGGLCEALLSVQMQYLDELGYAARRRAIARIYSDELNRAHLAIPADISEVPYLLRYPAVLRGKPQRRDRLVGDVAQRLRAEIGPFNWRTCVHLVPRFRTIVRTSPDIAETERLVSGLLNLPVHSQVTEDMAFAIARAVNNAVQ